MDVHGYTDLTLCVYSLKQHMNTFVYEYDKQTAAVLDTLDVFLHWNIIVCSVI